MIISWVLSLICIKDAFYLFFNDFYWGLAELIESFGVSSCLDNSNKIMSKDKYVEQTLTLPSELPLFNYNINF